jgi:hypothetical protein
MILCFWYLTLQTLVARTTVWPQHQSGHAITITPSFPQKDLDHHHHRYRHNHLLLPSDVHTREQLSLLPQEFRSNDPTRPLLLTATTTTTAPGPYHKLEQQQQEQLHHYTYSLRPLWYSVIFILIIEGLERLTYYGVTNTETAYLTGSYDHHHSLVAGAGTAGMGSWNANLTAVQATSYTSASIGIAYTSPFLGGIVADGWLGDYGAIVVGVLALYLPGVILIASTTVPHLLGRETFNMPALTFGLLLLMPLGTGFIKAIVNGTGSDRFVGRSFVSCLLVPIFFLDSDEVFAASFLEYIAASHTRVTFASIIELSNNQYLSNKQSINFLLRIPNIITAGAL